jgi:hypothetical protein
LLFEEHCGEVVAGFIEIVDCIVVRKKLRKIFHVPIHLVPTVLPRRPTPRTISHYGVSVVFIIVWNVNGWRVARDGEGVGIFVMIERGLHIFNKVWRYHKVVLQYYRRAMSIDGRRYAIYDVVGEADILVAENWRYAPESFYFVDNAFDGFHVGIAIVFCSVGIDIKVGVDALRVLVQTIDEADEVRRTVVGKYYDWCVVHGGNFDAKIVIFFVFMMIIIIFANDTLIIKVKII